MVCIPRKQCLPPESQKEDPRFLGGISGDTAHKILGTSNPGLSQLSDSDD